MKNKLHFAIHGHTAAELIKLRADASKNNMGLTTWKSDKVRKGDVTIAKNYLTIRTKSAQQNCDYVFGLCRGSGRKKESNAYERLGEKAQCILKIQ